jgi:hypothetical protein
MDSGGHLYDDRSRHDGVTDDTEHVTNLMKQILQITHPDSSTAIHETSSKVSCLWGEDDYITVIGHTWRQKEEVNEGS